MTTQLSANPKQIMANHLAALQHYARRVVVQGEILAPPDEDDITARMREYLTIGISLKCTEKELVRLVYKGLFEAKRGCDCPGCLARISGDQSS